MQSNSTAPNPSTLKEIKTETATNTSSILSWAYYLATPVSYLLNKTGYGTQTPEPKLDVCKKSIDDVQKDYQDAVNQLIVYFYTEYNFLADIKEIDFQETLSALKTQLENNKQNLIEYYSLQKKPATTEEEKLSKITDTIFKLNNHLTLLKDNLVKTYFSILELEDANYKSKPINKLIQEVRKAIEKKHPKIAQQSQFKISSNREASSIILMRQAWELIGNTNIKPIPIKQEEKPIAPALFNSPFAWVFQNYEQLGIKKLGDGTLSFLSKLGRSDISPKRSALSPRMKSIADELKAPFAALEEKKSALTILSKENLAKHVSVLIRKALDQHNFWHKQLHYRGGKAIQIEHNNKIKVPKRIAKMRSFTGLEDIFWLHSIKQCAKEAIKPGAEKFIGLFTVRAPSTTGLFYFALSKLDSSLEFDDFAKSVGQFIKILERNPKLLIDLDLGNSLATLKEELQSYCPDAFAPKTLNQINFTTNL